MLCHTYLQENKIRAEAELDQDQLSFPNCRKENTIPLQYLALTLELTGPRDKEETSL